MIIPRYNLYRSYKYAIDLKNSGKYSEAISAFDALGDYKDSQAQKKLTSNEYLKSLKVGDTILFGEYEQDNNIENGKENIEWLILDKANNGCLIISKYALDCQLYNTSRTDVTWETCTLRTWLNDTFYNSAFSDAEKSKIAKSTVSADKNPIYSTDPGNATSDNVFLLTITEANKYFILDETRKCVPTAYAKAQGAYTSNDYKTASGEATCYWWLRSPGYYLNYTAYVFYDGGINDYGLSVSYGDFAVRPAMWITLD